MVSPTKLNLKVYQGATFKELIRWDSDVKAYVAITSISKAAPMVISTSSNTIPTGWRFKVTNVLGMKEVNSTETYYVASSRATNSVTVNDANSLGYTDYTSGGVVEYKVPVSLISTTARMQIRSSVNATTVLEELTTENGKILIDTTNSIITILISATDTAAYTFTTGVYSMEIVVAGEVTPFLYGNISVEKEITR